MRPDWYQATIEESPSRVLEVVGKLGHEMRPADQLARKHRYEQGFTVLHNEQGAVAHIFVGGNGGKPHALATSEAAVPFMSLVRNEWPDRHLVTRVDPAQDFIEPAGYDRLRSVALKVAQEHRMRFAQHVDELNPMAGRTQYIGSTSSEYRGRLYEKGLEMIAKQERKLQDVGGRILDTDSGELIKPEDLVRLELQARPKGELARRFAAQATMEQVWGMTDWAHELANEAMALDLERAFIRTRKRSKDDEALRWMCQQYGGVLVRRHGALKGWSALGEELGQIIAQQVQRQ